MTSRRFHELTIVFARGLGDKAEALAGDRLTPYQRARLVESMATDVRKACDILVPGARFAEVSRAAFDAAEDRGVDLREQTWHAQPRFDAGRKIFHYEHMTPVSTLVAEIRDCATREDVVDVLDRDLRVAWILKSENRELSRLGFTHRRADPVAAYRAAGIDLLPSLPDPVELGESPAEVVNRERLTWEPGDVKVTPPSPPGGSPSRSRVVVPPCSRCGARRANWLVTGSELSQAPGRLLAYCDGCRTDGGVPVAVSLPMSTFRTDPSAILEALYRSGAVGTDPNYVAELFGLSLGAWARSSRD